MIERNCDSHPVRSRVISRRHFLKLAISACLFTQCQFFQQPDDVPNEDDSGSDDWELSSLEGTGIDSEKLANMTELVRRGVCGNVHSILIVKGKELVFEEYFSGYVYGLDTGEARGDFIDFGPDTLHDLASIAKNITSSLVGIAIDHGFIRDVNEKLFTFFPEYEHLNDSDKDEITLEHLLTMTSGLEWKQYGGEDDTEQLFMVNDPIEYILKKPVVRPPGTKFDYHQANPILLGEIVARATGLSVGDFAEEYLFSPLGITNYEWWKLSNDVVYTAGGMRLRPRDMAKFGSLFLQEGEWHGKRVISEDWVRESTQARFAGDYGMMYGYLWWDPMFRETASYAALGRGGQGIFVLPDWDMVAVFTGGDWAQRESGKEPYFPLSILRSYIFPSVMNQ
jgi:CubicO group peptidase (beta-lactamase class C family)